MGLFSFNSIAQKWQDWTVAIAKAPYGEHEDFRINPKGNTDVAVFQKELEKLSDEFIKQYDTDNDNMISYEEFEKYEEAQLRENMKDVDEATLSSAKQALFRTFEHLNVDNENNSKFKLDIREIMNYFHTMDAFNKDRTVDGSVSPTEYRLMTKWLGEMHTKSGDHSNLLDMYLQGNFNVYKNYQK